MALDSFTLVHSMREMNELFTEFCFVCHRYLYYCFRSRTLFGFVLHIFRRHFGADISFVANLPRQRDYIACKKFGTLQFQTPFVSFLTNFERKNFGH